MKVPSSLEKKSEPLQQVSKFRYTEVNISSARD